MRVENKNNNAGSTIVKDKVARTMRENRRLERESKRESKRLVRGGEGGMSAKLEQQQKQRG